MIVDIIVDIITYIFIAIGCIANLLGVIGLNRFPDPYLRMHATTKNTTFGSIFLIGAVVIQSVRMWIAEGLGSAQSILILHSLVILAAILFTGPTSSHAIGRAAHKSGVKPARAVVDDLEGKDRD